MTTAVLEAVSAGMAAISVNYAFMEWKDAPVYPYFVGEYQEIEPYTEDGQQDCDFILTGFTRGSWSDLEAAKEKIENYFNRIDGYIVIASGAVAIFYAHSLVIPTGDAELKKIEIHLTIKEWKVK